MNKFLKKTLAAVVFSAAFLTVTSAQTSWLEKSVPSLYQTYKDHFDYVGLAAEYGNFGLKQNGADKYTAEYTWDKSWGNPTELYFEDTKAGIAKHANTFTTGNELKPQFLLAWWGTGTGGNQKMVDFKASNGKTIKVPEKLNNEKLLYAVLNSAKSMKIKMRGHVLVWHSQTPEDFFATDYKAKISNGNITNLVDKETMTARQEWYIKTVLGEVENWEKANGYGKGNHIIWAWDVVNEACADDATKTEYLRGSTKNTKDKKPEDGGSRWYQIYGNEEFIVNAFRFANAYAPSDVELCYNDYNEYMNYGAGWKTDAIATLITKIRSGSAQNVNGKSVKPRIDVMGMQSHVGVSWPGVSGYETALKRFLNMDLNVHVTELDFSAQSEAEAKKCYTDYFNMLQKYGNKSGYKNKIECVTIWGVCNENSWINPTHDGKLTYPVLFNLVDTKAKKYRTDWSGKQIKGNGKPIPSYEEGDYYSPNESFNAVIKAHK